VLQTHANAPSHDLRQSSTIRNPAHPSGAPAVTPRFPCPANGKNADACSSNLYTMAVNPATARLFVKKETLNKPTNRGA
jgi:hypothetical protein